MSFGREMKGKASHEAVVRIQDAELRFLDTFHHFISMRVDSDRKYTSGLSKMLSMVVKSDNSEFKDCCSVFGAWEVIIRELENLVKAIKSNSDHLQTSTLEILSQLINEKKQAKKRYLDERNRLDSDFAKVQDEMTKNKTEYFKCMERLSLEKAKFLDMHSKGKPGPKVDEAKAKFFRAAVHLHKTHNDYVISVKGAQEHQTMHRDSALPALLDCHQEEQEAFVHKVKYILSDYLKHTDTCSADFQTFSRNAYNAVHAIQPGKEYSGTFIDLHKCSLSPPIDFTFEDKLMDNYSGSLKANTIEINDLTVESLQERLNKLNEEINEIKNKLTSVSANHQQSSMEASRLVAHLGIDCSIENVNNYLCKRTQAENCTREILELEGNLKKLEKLAALIQYPLDRLGSDPAPTTSDIQDIAELDTSLATSSQQSQTASKDTTLMKSLGKMNLFKRNAKDGQSGTNVDDNGTDDRMTKKKSSPGYEKHTPLLSSPGGQNATWSMAKMREQGQLVDLNASEAKNRIADEQWFHGILPREEVQRLLVNDGDFLVRESKNKKTNESQFVLSIYWQGYRHFIIQFNPDQGWHFEGNSYPTIQELVRRQHESGFAVTTKSGAILKTPILREWEILNDDIELTVKIGAGNFGEVFKGTYKNNLQVAVKTCKDTLTEEQKVKFLQEGRILKQYKHPNIVKFIGIAAQKQPVMIVMEFIPKGALLSFLKTQAASLSVKQKVQMCLDASCGMEYLEGRGCIHRDLAARNCLVGDSNVIKISDFGMSREEQVYSASSGNNQVPIKWTAPEALNFAKYTSLCDVWSFGVLMWEIFSCGKTPYPGMSNIHARQWIEDGHRMAAPPGTPDVVYSLMTECWQYCEENRPHFNSVHKTLSDIVKKL